MCTQNEHIKAHTQAKQTNTHAHTNRQMFTKRTHFKLQTNTWFHLCFYFGCVWLNIRWRVNGKCQDIRDKLPNILAASAVINAVCAILLLVALSIACCRCCASVRFIRLVFCATNNASTHKHSGNKIQTQSKFTNWTNITNECAQNTPSVCISGHFSVVAFVCTLYWLLTCHITHHITLHSLCTVFHTFHLSLPINLINQFNQFMCLTLLSCSFCKNCSHNPHNQSSALYPLPLQLRPAATTIRDLSQSIRNESMLFCLLHLLAIASFVCLFCFVCLGEVVAFDWLFLIWMWSSRCNIAFVVCDFCWSPAKNLFLCLFIICLEVCGKHTHHICGEVLTPKEKKLNRIKFWDNATQNPREFNSSLQSELFVWDLFGLGIQCVKRFSKFPSEKEKMWAVFVVAKKKLQIRNYERIHESRIWCTHTQCIRGVVRAVLVKPGLYIVGVRVSRNETTVFVWSCSGKGGTKGFSSGCVAIVFFQLNIFFSFVQVVPVIIDFVGYHSHL